MGRPVVATDAGGLPEVVHHEATGLVVGGDDMVAFASAVERLLSDPSAARRMGALARTRARERFDWERHVTAYDVLYRRLAC
jgi:glycosyltransferase involved in cell wall biosynthesis